MEIADISINISHKKHIELKNLIIISLMLLEATSTIWKSSTEKSRKFFLFILSKSIAKCSIIYPRKFSWHHLANMRGARSSIGGLNTVPIIEVWWPDSDSFRISRIHRPVATLMLVIAQTDDPVFDPHFPEKLRTVALAVEHDDESDEESLFASSL